MVVAVSSMAVSAEIIQMECLLGVTIYSYLASDMDLWNPAIGKELQLMKIPKMDVDSNSLHVSLLWPDCKILVSNT